MAASFRHPVGRCAAAEHHPPVLPGHRIPGGVVWTLAFAPFIGYALELWTAGLNGMSFDEAYEAV